MKVGHKQVVSLIRQGGAHLTMKVVSVSRKPESEEAMRRRGKKINIYIKCGADKIQVHSNDSND